MVLDISVKSQVYMEDCEVCCHPIEVRYTVEDDAVHDFEAKALEYSNPGRPRRDSGRTGFARWSPLPPRCVDVGIPQLDPIARDGRPAYATLSIVKRGQSRAPRPRTQRGAQIKRMPGDSESRRRRLAKCENR